MGETELKHKRGLALVFSVIIQRSTQRSHITVTPEYIYLRGSAWRIIIWVSVLKALH